MGRVYELMIQGQSFRKLFYKSATAPSVEKIMQEHLLNFTFTLHT